jgi:hypothetical protein
MPRASNAADAEVVMRLYELRREDKLRIARNWFFANFKGIKSTDEFLKLAPYGSDENAWFRMVVSYWDMAASFVNSGAVNPDLFFRSSNEMLFVWLRASDVIPELRKSRNNPLAFTDLEQGAKTMQEWMETRAPGAYEGFRKMVLG